MIFTRDYWPDNSFEELIPEFSGIDSNFINTVEKLIYEEFSNDGNLIVLKDGYKIYEYYNDNSSFEKLFDLKSVTKSILSLLVGNYYITNPEFINKKLSEISPIFTDINLAIGDIKIENLLTMTSGLNWKNSGLVDLYVYEMIESDNWLDFIASKGMDTKQIDKFQYSSAASHLLGIALSLDSRKDLEDLALRMFSPLNITDYKWERDPQKFNTGGFGLYLKLEDLAKLGVLVNSGGTWNNEIIISRDYLAKAFTRQSKGIVRYNYGYHFWLSKYNDSEIISARGKGGQLLSTIPKEDIVIAFCSNPDNLKKPNPDKITHLILDNKL
ncbi:MAG: serine hydrolase [Candidatus Delongbacteria bacterium]|nr:serine hydrolase [Candidatus Delongbacteria bacterium]MBN2836369.1 serine hydrolase [Candidatus Delongbacteria bacterium]